MLLCTYPFELPPLPYAYDALEPYIDAKTMHIHHDKHFLSYISNLNKALKDQPYLQRLTLRQLLTCHLPDQIKSLIQNNAGGVYNHSVFFDRLSPLGKGSHMPKGNLMWMIQQTYGTWDNFKNIFTEKALGVFGSGWVSLVFINQCELKIICLSNQDTAVPYCAVPIILCDVWEHAYYLKYNNMRVDYVNNIWNIYNFPDL